MDNDSIHKFAYRHRELFADLLRLAVPNLAAELALDEAEEVSAAHVSAGEGSFEQRHGDMTWRVPFKEGALRDGTRPYLLVLLEFQSTVDRTMDSRMRNYGNLLRERLIADGTAEREGGLPWLLPVVLYNGSERWTAPNFVTELAPLPSLVARHTLAAYQPDGYVLLSLEQLLAEGGGDLAHLPSANRAVATMRLQLGRTPADLEWRLRTEWARFSGAWDAAARRVFHRWAQALLADMVDDDGEASALPSLEELEGHTEEADMTTISQARLGKWYREFRAENVAIGVARGMARGMARGIEEERTRAHTRSLAMIQQMAAIKFGDSTAEQLAARLGTDDTVERIEAAGVAIMECSDGEELLARVATLASSDGEN